MFSLRTSLVGVVKTALKTTCLVTDIRNDPLLPGARVTSRAVGSRVQNMFFVARTVGPRAGRAMIGRVLLGIHVCVVRHVDPYGHRKQQDELIHASRWRGASVLVHRS